MCVCIYLYTYHIFFIDSSTDGHFSCFYILIMVNNASANMRIQISHRDNDFISFKYTPRSGIARSYGNSIFVLNTPPRN